MSSNGEHERANVSQQEATEPVLCANGCGFYGNPLMANLCSKCFKDTHSNKAAAAAIVEPPACERPARVGALARSAACACAQGAVPCLPCLRGCSATSDACKPHTPHAPPAL